MPTRNIRVYNDRQLLLMPDGSYGHSVSVAAPDALVVIENLRYIDNETMMADIVIMEDE